jgi:hypothetical protein
MKPRRISALFVVLVIFLTIANATDQKPPATPPMSKETRMDLIRAFNSELVYIRSPFPMGKKGLTLKDGQVTPRGPELEQMISMWGPAVKPGDQARISDIVIKDNRIHFEINGGPVHRQKWYQHISIVGASSEVPLAPSDSEANPRGSYVDLVFDHYVPDVGPRQLKDMLRPVFDFDSKSPLDAYLETVPPKVKEAIKNHNVLVGMNREMVIFSKGRPPKKEREKTGDTEYEEWIYGEPPKDVDFIRFVGDEVVRVETMKVGGEKMVRTEKEVDLQPQPSLAKAPDQGGSRPPNAPSLRRPGEPVDDSSPTTVRPASPPVQIASPPSGPPSQTGGPSATPPH